MRIPTKDPKEVDQILGGTTEVITAVAAQSDAVTIRDFAKFGVGRRGRRRRAGLHDPALDP